TVSFALSTLVEARAVSPLAMMKLRRLSMVLLSAIYVEVSVRRELTKKHVGTAAPGCPGERQLALGACLKAGVDLSPRSSVPPDSRGRLSPHVCRKENQPPYNIRTPSFVNRGRGSTRRAWSGWQSNRTSGFPKW